MIQWDVLKVEKWRFSGIYDEKMVIHEEFTLNNGALLRSDHEFRGCHILRRGLNNNKDQSLGFDHQCWDKEKKLEKTNRENTRFCLAQSG